MPQHDAALEAQFAGRFNVVFTGTFTPAQSLDMVIRAVLDARAAGRSTCIFFWSATA